MSERNDWLRTSSSLTNLEIPIQTGVATETIAANVQAAAQAPLGSEEDARQRIAVLDREARALGNSPGAALLFHEIGLLWEEPLKNPRNAAVAFQNAYKIAPTFLSNIRAARRLFADVGNWAMVLQLLEKELSVVEDTRLKAALLAEKATILEERMSREQDALAAWRQCLELEPVDVTLLTQLEGVYAAKNDHASLVQVSRLLASSLSDAALKAHHLTFAAMVLEDRLKQPEAAAALFREAFALDRRDLLLLTAVKRVAERENNVEELILALSAEAEVLGAEAAPTFLRLSKVLQRKGDAEGALSALLSARKVSPTEPLVLSELAAIYESQGRHEDLASVLHAWVQCISDESEHVAINLRLAALYEEDLKRDEEAIAPYRAILARIPGHQAALAGLGKLFFRTQDWQGLLDVYEAEIATAEDPRQKASKTFKAAEVLEERLGRQEEAIARYNHCLQLQPGFLPAQKALTRLYEKQGRYADLVGMYEQDLLQTADRDQLIATLNKMATLYEERLDDLEHAIDCMKRILDLASDHLPTVRNLARLYERGGQWRELIQMHELEASLAGDTKQVLSLHHRSAELLDEQLKDRAGAILAYEKVLALSPSYLPALKALGRLYAQDGRWSDLVRMYRAEAEISASTEQAAALIHKIGELFEHRLKDENEAIAAYQEVLTLAPSYFPALRALARIYRAQASWESLIEVLRAEAANRTDPSERANALFQAAAIWEDQLDRSDMAVDGYQEVLRLTPGHTTALRALERIFTARATPESVKDLIAVLDRETQTGPTPNARATAYLKLARIYLDRLGEPPRAAQCCEAALALEPTHLAALKTLERIRASDRSRRSELRTRIAERVTEPRLKTALRLAAAADQDRMSAESSLALYREAFAGDPRDLRVGFALERGLRTANDAKALVELYEHRLATVEDRTERVTLLVRMGELREAKLVDLEGAASAYAEARELMPTYLPALQGLRRVRLKQGDAEAGRRAWEAEAEAAHDPRVSIDAWVSAARLSLDSLKDADGAIALYKKALDKDPLDAAASAGIEELLAQRGGAADLASLHERRGEAKLALRDLPAAAQSFFNAAQVQVSLREKETAMALVDRALTAQATHIDALELKARLCQDANLYAEAAAALTQRVQQGGEAHALASVHLTLGALYQDHLSDAGRAAAHLQTTLTTEPNNLEALDRLASLHAVSRNWTGAADCLKRLLEIDRAPAAEARNSIALAKIVDEGFGDPLQASQLYRRALELIPGDAALIEQLVNLYERTGNLPELIQMLEQQAEGSSDPSRKAALKLKIADLYSKSLSNAPKAIESYRQVVELEWTNVPAHVALAELYTRDSSAVQLAIEEHRHLLAIEPTRAESLHALFRLWLGTKQNDRAWCAAAILHFLREATEEEAGFYTEGKSRVPQECAQTLGASDLDGLLLHPAARGALVEVLRAIGDQLTKVYPPDFATHGIDRKADRLKSEHAVSKAIRAVATVFGIEDFEVYSARVGQIFLETTSPLAVCVGQEVVRKFNAREQKFLIARAAFDLVNRAAVLPRLSLAEKADLLGNAIRMHVPDFDGLGRRNDEQTKQIRKACSRKAVKQLEAPATALAGSRVADFEGFLTALSHSADRAGLLLAGDVSIGLSLLLREDPSWTHGRNENPEAARHALQTRQDMKSLLGFALSDDFFRLRARVGLALS